MNLDDVKQKAFELPSEGSHVGVLYSIISLGHQRTKFGIKPLLELRWELPEVVLGNGKKAIVISKQTAYKSEKSNLYQKILKGSVDKKILDNPDASLGSMVESILNKPVLLSIAHSVDGRFANVDNVMPLPKAMAQGNLKTTNPLVLVKDPDNIPEDTRKLLTEKTLAVLGQKVDPFAALAEENDDTAAF